MSMSSVRYAFRFVTVCLKLTTAPGTAILVLFGYIKIAVVLDTSVIEMFFRLMTPLDS